MKVSLSLFFLVISHTLAMASLHSLNENQVMSVCKSSVQWCVQVSLGQSKYREVSQASALPRYGPCWLAALGQLQTKCDVITEETHSR